MTFRTAIIAAGCLAAGLSLAPAQSSAQTISLGGDEQTLSVLERAGYRYGRITSRDLTIIRTEACKNGGKFRVKVSILGKITSEQRLGGCDIGPPKRRAEPNPRRQPEGRTPPMGTEQLRRIAARAGLSDVEIIDAELPRYAVRGCRGTARFDVTLNRRGRIVKEVPAGTCRTPIAARDLPGILEAAGLNRTRILRDDRAPYLAEGCRASDLLEVRIDRFGRVSDERRIGRCRQVVRMTEAKIGDKMRSEGLTDIQVSTGTNGFTVQACDDERRVKLVLDAAGNSRGEQVVGTCASQTVTQVLKTLEQRGATNVVPLVEGCFRGDRFRWTFDRRGNRSGRERVGRC